MGDFLEYSIIDIAITGDVAGSIADNNEGVGPPLTLKTLHRWHLKAHAFQA